MNNDAKNPARRMKPLPWKCGECGEKAIYLERIVYTTDRNYDGRMYALAIPDFEIGRCANCGHRIIPNESAEQIDDALRKKVGLLSPAQISENLAKGHVRMEALAEMLDVPSETIARWIDGCALQTIAQDKLMRLYFNVPAARQFLDAFKSDRAFDSIPA